MTAEDAVSFFEVDLRNDLLAFQIADVRAELAGHDLACWCPLDQPCHADVLLEVANRKDSQSKPGPLSNHKQQRKTR